MQASDQSIKNKNKRTSRQLSVPTPRASRRALDPPLARDRLSHAPESLVLRLRQARARERAGVRAGDGHGGIRLLARCGGHVLYPALGRGRADSLHGGRGRSRWRRGRSGRWGRVEAVLGSLGRGGVDLDRRWLESEWLGGDLGRGFGFDEAGPGEAFFGLRGGVVDGGREAGGFDVLGVGWGEGTEAGSVGCGLGAELGEVEI